MKRFFLVIQIAIKSLLFTIQASKIDKEIFKMKVDNGSLDYLVEKTGFTRAPRFIFVWVAKSVTYDSLREEGIIGG